MGLFYDRHIPWSRYVKDKKWIVFIHGGEFAWNNNIGAGYAILAAVRPSMKTKTQTTFTRYPSFLALFWTECWLLLTQEVAQNSDMGVLAIDYRTSQNGENQYPAAVVDVLQAVGWLHEAGARSVSLFGDSSGATQVVQVR